MNQKNKKIKTLPELIQYKNGTQINNLSSEDINVLVKENQIPLDLAINYFKQIEDNNQKFQKLHTFLQENPALLEKDINSFIQSLPTKTLKKTIKDNKMTEDFYNNLIKNWDKYIEVLTLVEEIRKNKKPNKFRQSGHFIDMKLTKNKTSAKSIQKNKEQANSEINIVSSSISIKTSGIRLTPSEDKLMIALTKLLHDKSENINQKSDKFYTGNENTPLIKYGNNIEVKPAAIKIKPVELYKEYLGKDKFSGKEIKNIQSILLELADKKFMVQYDRQRIIKQGETEEKKIDRIEDFQSLIHIMSGFEGLTEQEIQRLNNSDLEFKEQKKELIIVFNPILTDQINSKYVEYPSDINQRTMIACGGASKVTESTLALRDYLIRELSNHRYVSQMYELTLIEQLHLNTYATNGRKKLLKQRINNAIEANKKLGLILSTEIITGTKGQEKYIFTLNQEFK